MLVLVGFCFLVFVHAHEYLEVTKRNPCKKDPCIHGNCTPDENGPQGSVVFCLDSYHWCSNRFICHCDDGFTDVVCSTGVVLVLVFGEVCDISIQLPVD